MEIGVIGVESGHVRFYADALKLLYPSGDKRITRAWCGDAPYSETAYESILDANHLINESDAVIVALRNGMHHAGHAIRCLKAGKPVYVDKPFALLPEDAAKMQAAAEETDTFLTGGSALCYLPQISGLKTGARQCKSASIRYWSDPFSPYGGWAFYGSHICDLCTAIFGNDYISVEACQNGGNIQARANYQSFSVSLSTTAKHCSPVVEIDGQTTQLSEKECFYYAMRQFTQSKTGYDNNVERLTASVRLMGDIFKCINGA